MLVHSPALFEAESASTNCARLERPVAVADRRPHAGIAEADDVGLAITGDVGQEARVLVHSPALLRSRALPARTARPGTMPSPLLIAVHTPASPKPTMSALPSPVMSARKRGCLSTRQPCSKPSSASTNCGSAKSPPPLLRAVHAPASPKPTMSALPSPVMSARKRGMPVDEPSPRSVPVGALLDVAQVTGAK